MTNFENLVASVEALKVEAEKFFVKGNNAAGTRLRKGLQSVKKLANELRKDVSAKKATDKTAA